MTQELDNYKKVKEVLEFAEKLNVKAVVEKDRHGYMCIKALGQEYLSSYDFVKALEIYEFIKKEQK